MAAYCLFTGRVGREIREKGILSFGGLLRWPQIQAYQWESDDTLALTVRRAWPFGGVRILRIPPHQKEAVQQILAQHVAGAQVGPG